mgnify:CR=1 FL=1
MKKSDFVQPPIWEIDEPGKSKVLVILVSQPPVNKCLITNIYWDPDLGKPVFEYDDTPQP